MTDRKKKYTFLAVWAVICLLITGIGIGLPVTKSGSLGLEGANQANLKTATEELTEGRLLEFSVQPPEATAEQIGFFVATQDQEWESGILRLTAFDGEELIGGQDFFLNELTGDQFLFMTLDHSPEELTVRMVCDAKENGPAIWLNETTTTPGQAWMDGTMLDKSLVYNLIYTEQVHEIGQPVLKGLILLLAGLGIAAAGGLQFDRKKKEKPCSLPKNKQKLGFRNFLSLGCMLLCGALLFFYLYDTRIRIAQNTTEKVTILEADGELLPITEETAVLHQIVRPEQEKLTGFGVRFWVEGGAALTEGTMHASVMDRTDNKRLCETEIQAGQFLSGEYIGLLFEDSQTGVQDHEYEITLTFSQELWDSGLAVMTSGENLCVNAYLYFNIFLKKFFFVMFLGIEGFITAFWYALFVRKAKIETIFLITVLGFGLFYNVLLTPQMVPDEAKHIDMAYRYSNELLGYESLGDTSCLMRAEDAETVFTSSPSFRNYRNIYKGLFSRISDERMVEQTINSNIEGSFLFYAPAVLGMTAARLLGLGTVPMLLLARYLNLLVFTLLVWFGMKRLPFGKLTLFLIAVLPINLQQCTSFSHDAVVHGIILLFSCLCLEAIYSTDKITGQQILLLELLGGMTVYCKSGSYLPLLLLLFLIPAGAYEEKWKKWAASGCMFGMFLLVFVQKNLSMVTGMASATAATSVVSAGDGTVYTTGYTLSYFLKDPLELIYMIVNTILDKGGFYLESLVGYKLGWVEIETSVMIVFLFLLLLLLSVCGTREESPMVTAGQRTMMVISCLGCAGLIVLGMLLSWTPMGHVSVEGVQGRYFLPFLLILLSACKNQTIQLRRRLDQGILTAAMMGQLLTIAYVIKQVMSV